MTKFNVRSLFAYNSAEKEISGIEFMSVEQFNTEEEAAAAIAAFPKSFGLKVRGVYSMENGRHFYIHKTNAFGAKKGNDANETAQKRVKKMLAVLDVEFIGGSLNSATREQTMAWLG